jgi:uncharacterized protein (DUF2236 family)
VSFLPSDSPARVVNVDPGNIIGGVSALLMQALHPAVAAGFVAHSNYREDPFGRLIRTATFLREVTFGSEQFATEQIARVTQFHSRVRGANALGLAYDATAPQLLEWVYLTLIYGFCKGFTAFGDQHATPSMMDAYVSDMARVGSAFGIRDLPDTMVSLALRIDRLARGIEPSSESFELVEFLRSSPTFRRTGLVAFRAASSLLPRSLWRQARAMRIPTGEHPVSRVTTRYLIDFVRWSFGTDPNLN